MTGREAPVRRLSALLGIVCLVLGISAAAAASSRAGPWVVLDSGRLGDYRWSVKVKRSDGPVAAGSLSLRPVCIRVGLKRQLGPFNYSGSKFGRCDDDPGNLGAAEPPLIANGSLIGPDGRPRLTAVGLVAAPAVRRVRVYFADGDRTSIRLDRMTPEQASRTGLARARYAAFSVRGGWPAVRLVTISAKGAPLWDSAAAPGV